MSNLYEISKETYCIPKIINNKIILLNTNINSNDITILDKELNVIFKKDINNDVTLESMVFVKNKYYLFCNDLKNVYNELLVYVYDIDFNFLDIITIPINYTTKFNYVFTDKHNIILLVKDKEKINFSLLNKEKGFVDIIVKTYEDDIYCDLIFDGEIILLNHALLKVNENYDIIIRNRIVETDEIILGAVSSQKDMYVFTKKNNSTSIIKYNDNETHKGNANIATNTEKVMIMENDLLQNDVYSLIHSNNTFYIVKNQ